MKKTPMVDRVREMLAERGEQGAGYDDMLTLGSLGKVKAAAQKLGEAGIAVWRYDPRSANGRTRKQWYLAGMAPTKAVATPVKPLPAPKGKRLQLAADAPAVVPSGVKVTVCQPFPECRWGVTLPRGGGQITRDWREARLQRLVA